MKEMEYLEELTGRYSVPETVKKDIRVAYELLKDCYEQGGKVLIAGNGGSCADGEHIVGGLMKGFVKRRSVSPEFAHALRQTDSQWGTALAEGLQGTFPATALTGYTALSTAFLNDADRETTYTQQLCDYGKKGNVLVGIFTLGNARNVIYATAVAKVIGIKAIGLVGKDGGALAKANDVPIAVLGKKTLKIQELHLPVCHVLCLMLGEHFYEV